ncbi:hypothetical protein [Chengkuizengella axinellae]|uniref:Uncharacterized protein n=1 Tax=Chengkuizengella axinellae TaxID=3064388 RepID=A0ABT9J3M4_9BACL|nr:hypothetical protein [Chengkuizengella sp. 2205SS18-9]MDP5276188.1 hypothetical protein [Chengkuizengella sp. 2205SS18-9]
MKIINSFGKVFVALLLILIYELWIENSEEAQSIYGTYVSPIVDSKNVPLIIPALLVVVIVALINYYGNKVRTLQESKNNDMQLLVESNQQLNAYRIQDLIDYKLSKFLEKEASVSSIQLYKYTIKHAPRNSYIKVEYVNGKVDENININGIVQSYYTFNYNLYSEFKNAVDKKNIDRVYLISFISKHIYSISIKSDKLTQEDAVKFAFIELAAEILGFESTVFLDPEKKKEIINLTQIGIFKTIISDKFYYAFSYEGKGDKSGRNYIARKLTESKSDQNYLFVMVVNKEEDHAYHNIITKFEGQILEVINLN